jgi:hypothetical protein
LREKFEEMERAFEETKVKAPKDLRDRVCAILTKQTDLHWNDALRIVLDATQLDEVRAAKQRARKKAGDFTERDEDDAVDDQD